MFVLSKALFAQPKIGVIITYPESSFPTTSKLMDSLQIHLKTLSYADHLVYDYSDLGLAFKSSLSSTSESVADVVLLYNIDLEENLVPKLILDLKDPTLSRAHFQLSPAVDVLCKWIDPESNTVAALTKYYYKYGIDQSMIKDTNERRGVFLVPNAALLLGPNGFYLEKSNPEKYNLIVAKLHQDFKARFIRFFESKKSSMMSAFRFCERNYILPEFIPCKDILLENEKAKRMKADIPISFRMDDYELMQVFSLDTVNGFIYSNAHGIYWRNPTEKTSVSLEMGLSGKAKEAGDAYISGKPLYTSLNLAGGYGLNLNDQRPPLYFGTHIKFEQFGVMNLLLGTHKINLIDFAATPYIKALREHYKQASFISDNFDVHWAGAKFILEFDKQIGKILDVQTATLIGQYAVDQGKFAFIELIMDVFNLEINVIEILNGDEKRVKKMRLYTPFRFSDIEYLEILEKIPETVNGKEIFRSVQIGQCQAVINSPGHLEEFVVTKGENEVAEALNRKANLIFRHKEFTFLGKSYY